MYYWKINLQQYIFWCVSISFLLVPFHAMEVAVLTQFYSLQLATCINWPWIFSALIFVQWRKYILCFHFFVNFILQNISFEVLEKLYLRWCYLYALVLSDKVAFFQSPCPSYTLSYPNWNLVQWTNWMIRYYPNQKSLPTSVVLRLKKEIKI